MTSEELLELLELIQREKCETRTREIKSANLGCPQRLYDTLSSFSNQDDGGVIVFGINEDSDYEEVGVYDPQDIQKKINEQCLQMEPVVRPQLTVVEKNNRFFVSAEIPAADIVDRPVFYSGSGRLRGSYIRCGDSDERMTEYEIYSFEAYRKKYQDDIREVSRAPINALDHNLLSNYINLLKNNRPNLSTLADDAIYDLMSIKSGDCATVSSVLNFSPYPQAYFPQLCITAIVVPGEKLGDLGTMQERFIDNKRIIGTINEMLDGALSFVRKNMKNSTVINPSSGKRIDITEYPILAVREAILNALVHRDYSIHTEGMPIQIIMYNNRIEIKNPGGIYGRIRVDQLGKIQPDTRNPVLASELEILGVTENRYSGIPTIRKLMKDSNLSEPLFLDERGTFTVILYNDTEPTDNITVGEYFSVIDFCRTPRTRKEIADFFDIKDVSYAIRTRIQPLIEEGVIKLMYPDKPKSSKQKYYADEK
ncbi:MAG: putative DNA binding domain-containing protein [Saccharofermentans sp.]|nr:putative DNA binding domain-containing protein [Saccharofermentans sp.]